MGSEGTALIDAIYNEAVSDANLMATVVQTGDLKRGIYYNEAPEEASMPYIVFKVADQELNHDFCDYYVKGDVVFNIYDQNTSITNIANIKDKLTTVFDRAVLTYTGKTAVGCLRTNDGDPERTVDGWMCTIIYNISYS